MSTIGYISTDGGQTWQGVPDSAVSFDCDTHLESFEPVPGAVGARASVTMHVRKIHIGALKPFLGEHYREFRRRYLSARKHRQGCFRK